MSDRQRVSRREPARGKEVTAADVAYDMLNAVYPSVWEPRIGGFVKSTRCSPGFTWLFGILSLFASCFCSLVGWLVAWLVLAPK